MKAVAKILVEYPYEIPDDPEERIRIYGKDDIEGCAAVDASEKGVSSLLPLVGLLKDGSAYVKVCCVEVNGRWIHGRGVAINTVAVNNDVGCEGNDDAASCCGDLEANYGSGSYCGEQR